MPKSTTDKYQMTREYLEKIISLMPGHVYWKDRNGVLQGCNDEQAQSIGLSSRLDIVGLTAYETLPKDFADEVTRTDKMIMETGIQQTVEEIFTSPNGEKSAWLSKKVPLSDNQNNIIGILGISFEITAEKQLEQLKKEKEIDEEKIKSLQASGAAIAHELRTPLATIRGAVKTIDQLLPILIQGYKLAKAANLTTEDIFPQQYNYLLEVTKIINEVINQSNAVIDMQLMNASKRPINLESAELLSISQCISKAINQYPYNPSELSKIVHFDKANIDFNVKGFEPLLHNILNNLLKNALYFVRKAGKGEIFIYLSQADDFNYLHLKDTGMGITEEIQARLFNRFLTTEINGTGLGLAFCKDTMQGMGGDITCLSVYGEYTEFLLKFPNI